MKLLIVLSIITYGYADKLDRAYLPPVNAATAGGSPGALTAPGVSASGRPGPAGSAFGQGIPSGRQPGSSLGQSSPSYGGISETTQKGPGFGQSGPSFGQSLLSGSQPGSGPSSPVYGAPNGPGFGTGINEGTSGINQFQGGAGVNVPASNGRVPLLGANAPFGSSQNTFGSTPGSGTFNAGAQQTYSPGSTSIQGFGQGAQVFNAPQAQAYQPERAQAAADRNAGILKYINENDGESYQYSYETSNGISAEESGVATNGVRAQGGFSYTGDDGQAYSLTYTADENGFQPQGEHLPTPHPIPEEILKSIEENARAAAAGTQEGAYRPEEYESEGQSQEYNVGQTSYNQPGQSPATQGQSNQFSVNQGAYGLSGQPGLTSIKGPNKFASGTSGPQEQYKPYQQGSGGIIGPASQFGQSAQIGQVKPGQGSSQFATGQSGPQGQSGQYQTSFGSSQGPFGQSSSQGLIGQGIGQSPQAPGSNGYNYNQPQNVFGSSTLFGSTSDQKRPLPNQGNQIISTVGSQKGQNNFGLQSGKVPSNEISFGTSQYGSGYRPTGSAGIFNQGQNQLSGNKPFGLSQGSQLGPGSQGSSGITASGSSGYQYGANANRPTFGNRPGVTNSQSNQGSQYRPNEPSTGAVNGIKGSTQFGSNGQFGQGQQYQQNGNRPFAGSTGSNQGISLFEGDSGIQKPGSGSVFGQTSQPSFESNVGLNQGSSQFGQKNQQSTSVQGSAPYQYNKPSQSFSTQQRPGSPGYSGATGSSSGSQGVKVRPGINTFGSQVVNGRPDGSSTGSPGVFGQSPGYSGSQGVSGRPTFSGTQRVDILRPEGSSEGQQQGSSFPGSLSGTGQGATYTGTQGVNKRPNGAAPGFQDVNDQRPSSPGFSGSSQGNQGRPEQFEGPRQPPSFNSQEGYKY